MCSAPFSRCVKHKGNERKCECIQECPNAVKQVCASDNVTYDNECLLKKTACEKGEELTLVKNGNCAGISFSRTLCAMSESSDAPLE